MHRLLLIAALVAAAVAVETPHAAAIPAFAHEYALACQKCHSVIPRLNAFGLAFADNGFALPGAQPQRAFRLSVKFNLAYTSEPDRTGLPKAIVDEVELFVAGTIGRRTHFFVEQYAIDGGNHGSLRDAWLEHRFTSDGAKIPVFVQGGSFTLPLPVDPETFRETSAHYAIFDQTAGGNPFTFFGPKTGLQFRAGSALRGTSVRLLALQGHDRQSGLASLGTDTMLYAQHVVGPLTFSAYRYDGSRPGTRVTDRFRRLGYGVGYAAGRWSGDAVLQAGHDTSVDGAGTAALTSGGFAQVRYEFNRRLFGLVRYEGTGNAANGMSRDLVPALGIRTSRNARFTIEDVVTHVPQAKHTMNAQYTVAY